MPVTTLLILLNVVANATAFGAIFILTGELFPTAIRGTAFASSNFVGRVGSFLAPSLPELVPKTFPTSEVTENSLLVLVVVAALSAALMCTLEETRGKSL
ncbi:unnamed protein product [Amoebophrya sp. A25]|nr:unnamed protein product [Amoebophrya sp. A25]|eukprot:GSA25T00018797001.1